MHRRMAWILAAVAIGGGAACGGTASEKRFQDRVAAAAIASAPDPATARVLVVLGEARKRKACGWLDTGGGRGVVPFAATDREGRPIHIRKPDVTATDAAGRIRRAYETQFVMVICDDHGWLAPMPDGVRTNPAVDGPLKRLVNTPGDAWLVVPADGSAGFLAVSKAPEGGLRLSPVFQSEHDAQRWIIEYGRTRPDPRLG